MWCKKSNYENNANWYNTKITQQTVSMNTCLEDLLSSKIFGLKRDGKLGHSLAEIFMISRERNACCFRRDKNVVLGTKKPG